MKIFEIRPHFCDNIPEGMDDGILYISEKYKTAIHLCACGCKGITSTPLGDGPGKRWALTKDGNTVSLSPSIGNFSGENPYHAHYFITNNKIQWC